MTSSAIGDGVREKFSSTGFSIRRSGFALSLIAYSIDRLPPVMMCLPKVHWRRARPKGVRNTLTLAANGAAAQITGFSNTARIPEPGACALAEAGSLLLLLFLRRANG